MPVPVPSDVHEPVLTGFWLVLQQTPRVVISAPPSDVILPPEIASEVVMSVTVTVDKTARSGFFLHDTKSIIIEKIITNGMAEYEKRPFFIL
jgi:hypothetical protein